MNAAPRVHSTDDPYDPGRRYERYGAVDMGGAYFFIPIAADALLYADHLSVTSPSTQPAAASSISPEDAWAVRLLRSTEAQRVIARRVALHEAGHAVVMVMTGEPLGPSVRIYAEAEGDGLRITGGGTGRQRGRLGTAVIFCAGYAAEMEVAHVGIGAGDDRAGIEPWFGSHDYFSAIACLNDAGSGEHALSQHFQIARRLVKQNWGAVQSLADALYLAGALTGAEATAIVESATGWIPSSARAAVAA